MNLQSESTISHTDLNLHKRLNKYASLLICFLKIKSVVSSVMSHTIELYSVADIVAKQVGTATLNI